MQEGYIKLWRKTLKDPLWQNWKIWRLFEYMLMKASYKPHDLIVEGQKVHLDPGQLVFGRRIASIETGLTEKEIRGANRKLEKWKKTASKRASKFTIISIMNWDRYQCDEIEKGQQKGQQRASTTPKKGHKQEGIYKKGKNNYVDTNVSSSRNGPKNSIPYADIISYLNEKTDRHFKPDIPKTKRLIQTLWNQGFNLEDFKKVIDNKTSEWIRDQKYSKYLRPETLFGTKFEGYLNEVRHPLSGTVSEKTIRTIDNLTDLELD